MSSKESVRTSAASPQVEGRLTEWLLRSFALLIMAFVVTRWGYAWWIDPSRWTALRLASEGVGAAF